MSTPTTCPHCGADFKIQQVAERRWTCGTKTNAHGLKRGSACYERQIELLNLQIDCIEAMERTAKQQCVAKDARIQRLEAALEGCQEFLNLNPPPPVNHKGSCGPESCCDAICVDNAAYADLTQAVREALAAKS